MERVRRGLLPLLERSLCPLLLHTSGRKRGSLDVGRQPPKVSLTGVERGPRRSGEEARRSQEGARWSREGLAGAVQAHRGRATTGGAMRRTRRKRDISLSLLCGRE